jgi:pentatricopeptide repeat protein
MRRPVRSGRALGWTRTTAALFAGLCLALLLSATKCRRNETKTAHVRPDRAIEPRLTIDAQREGRTTAPRSCEERTTSHHEAVQTLHAVNQRPECLDAVVDTLERLSRDSRDARILSDLSAARYVRATRRDGHADDFMAAFDAAEEAASTAPALPEARFNRALAREALHLDSAAAAWREAAAADQSPWALEAAERRKRLEQAEAVRAATQWDPERIRTIAERRDDAALAALVQAHPAAAQRYVEEHVLPQWATAAPDDARTLLALAKTIAGHLHTRAKDRYLLDAVAAINRATPSALGLLRDAHLALLEGRTAERVRPVIAIDHYRRAQKQFEQAGSPLESGGRLGEIIALFFNRADARQLIAMLEPLTRTADKHGYTALKVRITSTVAHLRLSQSLYIDAVAAYDAAIAAASHMRDYDTVAGLRARKAGILRRSGRVDDAAREALLALRYEAALPDVPQRHFVLGEMTENALALEHPRLALLYIDKGIELLQRTISNPQTKPETIGGLRNNLAIALRTRVSVYLALHRETDAEQDVNEAIRLAGRADSADESIRRLLLTRTYESAGQAALKARQPLQAVEAFDEALRQALPEEYRTYRAMLLVQRAGALESAGRHRESRRDLVAAIGEIRAEETAMLRRRARGEHEAYWNSYFSRFRETYNALIRNLFEAKEYEEAFAYAESFRAYEPLDLVLQVKVAPESFRRWAGRSETHKLPVIQRSLGANHYLVSFHVLPERTYGWIIGGDVFEPFEVPVTARAYDEWNAALRRHEAESDGVSFESVLEEAHDRLLEKPLARIRELAGGAEDTRIVFAPDRGIHGLPLAALRNRRTRHYVVEDFVVSVVPSATFYVFSRERDADLAKANERSVLLIGDPAFDRALSGPLDRLQWARSEVAKLEAMYAPHTISLNAERATVPAFFRETSKHAIVHFAGHAVSNAREPFRSVLLLARGDGHTGVLEAEELLQTMKIDRTRLLVLASCSSSGGVAVGPEGLAPLVRPFMTSGVPAVVGTLWNVRDEYSEAVLVAFHEHYRRGLDAGEALRQAQLGLIGTRNPALQSPLAWAPFQIIGHAESPFPSQP